MRTLNIKECAEFFKINLITAYEMAARGELPGAKIGRAWVFLEDDLVEYLRREVRRQQQERQSRSGREDSSPQPRPDPARVDVISAFPAIQRRRRGRRTPLPILPDPPERGPSRGTAP